MAPTGLSCNSKKSPLRRAFLVRGISHSAALDQKRISRWAIRKVDSDPCFPRAYAARRAQDSLIHRRVMPRHDPGIPTISPPPAHVAQQASTLARNIAQGLAIMSEEQTSNSNGDAQKTDEVIILTRAQFEDLTAAAAASNEKTKTSESESTNNCWYVRRAPRQTEHGRARRRRH